MVNARTIRQQEIIKGARAVIFSKGIERLTVREIAKVLRITNSALYRHFKSKNEIISLLIDDIKETLLSAIQESANKHADPAQKLEAVFRSHLSYAEQMKGTSFSVINQVSGLKNIYLKKKMSEVLNKYLSTIKGIFKEGMKTGCFQKNIDPESASILFFGSVQSAVTIWSLGGHKSSLNESYLNGVWDVYKNGVLTKKS